MKKPIKKTTPKNMRIHDEINEFLASVMSKISGQGNKIKNKMLKDSAYTQKQVADLKAIVKSLREFQRIYLNYADKCDIVCNDFEGGIKVLERHIEEKAKLEQESQGSKIEA